MFNGNYIKLDTILGQLRKYPFMEGLTKREAAHNLVTLLSQTGATVPLQRTYRTLDIKQHKALLPGDIVYLHGVRNLGLDCGSDGVPMKYATDIWHSVLHSKEAKDECAGEGLCPQTFDTLYGPKAQGDTKTTGGELEMSLRAWQVGGNVPRQYAENSYSINGTSIDTSFPCGFVSLSYDSVVTDEQGFPMIPDNKSFREAFKYFLLKNQAEPEYFRGNVSRNVYEEIEKQYTWYIGQASSSFKMPSPDQMESMINGLVRIIPRTNNHSDGWKSFNKKEDQGGYHRTPRVTKP